jgi:Na+/proline symporter
VAAQFVLGQSGVVLMLIIIFMAVTSAGSAEMMAVSTLFTYDIYKVLEDHSCCVSAAFAV